MPTLPAACALLLIMCTAACSRPEPPPTDQPPEPKAQASAQEDTRERHTELRDAIQAPIDKARGVEDTVLDAAEKQKADIDAQTGG